MKIVCLRGRVLETPSPSRWTWTPDTAQRENRWVGVGLRETEGVCRLCVGRGVECVGCGYVWVCVCRVCGCIWEHVLVLFVS